MGQNRDAIGREARTFPNTDDLHAVQSRLIELAKEHLPSPATLDMQAWDDGDFTCRIEHNKGFQPGGAGEISPRQRSKELRYDRKNDRIICRDYTERMTQDGTERDVHSQVVLETEVLADG